MKFKDGKNVREFGHFIVWLEYHWMQVSFIIEYDLMFRFFVVYCAISFLGILISDVFYSFHLLSIINRIPTLKNVIRSVTLKSQQLIMTSLLMLIAIYIFSVFGFNFMYDMYYNEQTHRFVPSKKGEVGCSTMLQCLITTLNYGLRIEGGFGDYLTGKSYYDKSGFYSTVVFSILFYFIISVVLKETLFGIIVDTFGELEEEKKELEEDIKNKCYICNIERHEFDRYASGFENHI